SRAGDAVCAILGAAARGIAPAVFHDYAAGMAGACTELQGAAAANRRCRGRWQGPEHLWISWVSAAAVGGHSDLPGGSGARWPGPGSACRADAGGSTPV